jgi:aryl-alcohol dehydrogenase-like predicted oxidoreductase
MEYRLLGRSGLYVSAFCFGAMTFGGGKAGSVEAEEARGLIDLCLEAGVNLIDTADVYSNGRSEEILGEVLKGRRQAVMIATKAFGPMSPGPNGQGLSRKHLIEACEASLKRLGTDYVDLYQVHNYDGLTPMEEILRAMDDLVSAGKVRYVGHSNFAAWHLAKAAGIAEKHNFAPFISQQIQYSLLKRDAEFEMLPAGVDQGVGALIWSPLAQGFLSGKFRREVAEVTRLGSAGAVSYWDDEVSRGVLEVLEEVAAGYPGASMSQVALNYVRRQPGVSSIIVGARNAAQLKDNLAAAGWSLSDADMAKLDRASRRGLPYPASHHRAFGRGRIPALPLQPIPPSA